MVLSKIIHTCVGKVSFSLGNGGLHFSWAGEPHLIWMRAEFMGTVLMRDMWLVETTHFLYFLLSSMNSCGSSRRILLHSSILKLSEITNGHTSSTGTWATEAFHRVQSGQHRVSCQKTCLVCRYSLSADIFSLVWRVQLASRHIYVQQRPYHSWRSTNPLLLTYILREGLLPTPNITTICQHRLSHGCKQFTRHEFFPFFPALHPLFEDGN